MFTYYDVRYRYMPRRYQELEQELTTSDLEPRAIAKLGKELSSLGRLMDLSNNRLSKLQSISELSAIEREEEAKGPSGEELLLLAREERLMIEVDLQLIESSIVEILTPKDEADDFGVVIEVRAGTGHTFTHDDQLKLHIDRLLNLVYL